MFNHSIVKNLPLVGKNKKLEMRKTSGHFTSQKQFVDPLEAAQQLLSFCLDMQFKVH